MKRNMLLFTAFAAALALLVPAWTGAQDQVTQDKTTQDQAMQDQATPDKTTQDQVAAEHTVVKGDTLWDISSEYLKDPFLWPEVWKLNPGIKNPDLIYPGELVRLPGMVAKPAAKPEEAEKPAAEAGAEEAAAGKEVLVPVEKAKVEKGPSPFEEEPLVDMGKTMLLVPEKKEKKVISLDSGKRPKIPVATPGAMLEAGFIADDLDDSLHILSSTQGKRDIYSLGDTLLTDVRPEYKPGDLMISVRSLGEVEHPDTGDDLGELIMVTGLLRVQGTKEDYLLCDVTQTINDIRPDDLLLPYVEPELVYEPVPKNPKLKGEWGYVVVAQEFKEMSGMMYTVYIDLGSDDDVKPGDTFDVRRSGGAVPSVTDTKTITRSDGRIYLIPYVTSSLDISHRDLPDVDIGTVQVISVKEDTATAKVLSFSEPIRPGFRVYYKD